MSMWIRGRLGRPIASVICFVMLVSFLLPLAPSPAQAQGTSNDLFSFFGKGQITNPTPIIVLDYVNKSGYATGMLGRTFADALTLELLNTRTFDVIKRSEVDKVLEESNQTVPLSWPAQAMIADRLSPNPNKKCNFTASGEIEEVHILKSKGETYAEVVVSTLVVNRITKMPLNGARIIQRSSPKINYTGNTDVLVHEALATAAYQTAQRLLDNRLPIATVLTSPRSDEVVLNGGSTIGLRKGMELVTIRRETITGRVRLVDVNPRDSMATILDESKGIAPGDKAVPIFALESKTVVGPEVREKAGLHLASIAALGLLAMFIGSGGGTDGLLNPGAPTVTSLADAYKSGYYAGGNLVQWPNLSQRVIAYIIYRDTNPAAPIAVVDGSTYQYIDTATPLPAGEAMESVDVEISINEDTGELEGITQDSTYDDNRDDLGNAEEQNGGTDYNITCRRVPLNEGDSCGYQIKAVYAEYDMGDSEGVEFPEEVKIVVGKKSPVSARVTLIRPPALEEPLDNSKPTDDKYKCSRVLGADSYQLQVSADPTFPANRTIEVPAQLETGFASATASLFSITQTLGLAKGQMVYWRMGARAQGQVAPSPWLNPNDKGYVFSTTYSYLVDETPPPPPGTLSRNRAGKVMPGPDKMNPAGRGGRSGRGMLGR